MARSEVDRSSSDGPVDRYKLLPRLQFLASFGAFLILVYAWRFWFSGECLRIFAVGVLVAGAALTSGFLLGFIFGIPRVGGEKVTAKVAAEPGDAQAADSGTQPDAVTPNSNLVEISDWLTKIMVGVGLVELNSLPAKLGKLAYYLGPGLRPSSQCDVHASCADAISSGQAAGLAIIVFYFTLGFLWGYVWTRLYFQRDLGDLVAKLQKDKQLTALIMSAEQFMEDGQLDRAMDCINEALEKNSRDGRAVLTKGRILKRQAMRPGLPNAEKERLLNQALAYADESIALLSPSDPEPVYNKACYQALLGLENEEVLRNLKIAFRIDPAMRAVAGEDTDLETLHQNADFIRLVRSEPEPGA